MNDVRKLENTKEWMQDQGPLNTFIKWMNKYPNFTCHIDFNSFDDNGFHSKGYLFEYNVYGIKQNY